MNKQKKTSRNYQPSIEECSQMAKIIQEMEPACLKAYNVRSANQLHWDWDEKPRPWEIKEVDRFTHGSIELGFVVNEYKMTDMVDLEEVNRNPKRDIGQMNLSELRWYIHTVQRRNAWAAGYSSPIIKSLASGALQLAGKRLDELIEIEVSKKNET